MSKISNYLIGMEEEGTLIYDNNKREYVPAGLTSYLYKIIHLFSVY